MKRNKFVAILALATAMAMTACDTPVTTETTVEPGDTIIETTIVGTDASGNPIVETVIVAAPTKAPSGTPAVTTTETSGKTTETTVGTTTETTTVATTTATTEATENGGGSSSGSGDSGSGSGSTSSGGSSSGGSSSGGSSSGGGNSTVTDPTTPEPTETTKPQPTETTSNYARRACGSCGNKTLVDTPHYHYTTPAKTHEETTESWDYGIQHCKVTINWTDGAKSFGNPPSITEDFDRKVDTSGNPTGDAVDSGAKSRAAARAKEWLIGAGCPESDVSGYFSWSASFGSIDKVGYTKTTNTVVDEPEHEYEVGAYVCDTCGAVETYGTPKQIR